MARYRKQSHVVYHCNYHIVWVSKYRFRIMEGVVKELLEQDVCLISEWKNVQIEEMNIQKDHIHLVVSIPPKLFISACMGILKGKTAMKLFKSYPQLKKKPYWGNHFWAPGYFVNTIGMDEELIKRYVKYQEEEEKKQENQNRDYHLF
ncbi:MAG TPA: IS200/IS605 family transposase [Bacteroidetes bacterium]|nr:IS200/IS605 family transposase [Bacteroidota bacterium]